MKLIELLITTIIVSCSFTYGFRGTIKEPCAYIDTVNITSGQMDDNGNIIFNGTLFPKEMYAQYNYEIVNYVERKSVNQHTRGCLCLIKPCIRLCCYTDETNAAESNSSIQCVSKNTISVQTNDDMQDVNLNDGSYGVLVGRPCSDMYAIEPEDHPDEIWKLQQVTLNHFLNEIFHLSVVNFQNGSIMVYESYFYHESYCLGGTENDTVNLFKCFEEYHHDYHKNLSLPIGNL